MTWALIKARECFEKTSSVAGYFPTPPGLSPLGRAVAVTFTLELLRLSGRKIPPETMFEAANCFDLPQEVANA